MLNYKRYQKNPVVDYPERKWPNLEIKKAPIWCSVDLRDEVITISSPHFTPFRAVNRLSSIFIILRPRCRGM